MMRALARRPRLRAVALWAALVLVAAALLHLVEPTSALVPYNGL